MRLQQWQNRWLPTSAISENLGSYTVTRTVSLSPSWYRRFSNTWECPRHAAQPCAWSRMAWSSATSKLSKCTYEKSSQCTRTIGTHLACRASTHDTTGLTPASLVFGRELPLPCDLLFGAPSQGKTHKSSQGKFSGPSTRHPQLCPPTSEAGQWPDEHSLPLPGQLWAASSVTKCGSIAPPAQRSRPSSNPHGRAYTR
jgi:hypothetical protein